MNLKTFYEPNDPFKWFSSEEKYFYLKTQIWSPSNLSPLVKSSAQQGPNTIQLTKKSAYKYLTIPWITNKDKTPPFGPHLKKNYVLLFWCNCLLCFNDFLLGDLQLTDQLMKLPEKLSTCPGSCRWRWSCCISLRPSSVIEDSFH